jgi:hypothetical protein
MNADVILSKAKDLTIGAASTDRSKRDRSMDARSLAAIAARDDVAVMPIP